MIRVVIRSRVYTLIIIVGGGGEAVGTGPEHGRIIRIVLRQVVVILFGAQNFRTNVIVIELLSAHTKTRFFSFFPWIIFVIIGDTTAVSHRIVLLIVAVVDI